MRVRKLTYLMAFGLICVHAHAQVTSKPDSTQGGKYALVLYAGGGLSSYLTPPGVPSHLETHSKTLGPSGSVRLMWLPDHRLRVGFESGWTRLYSYDIAGPGPTGKVDLVAVPLLLVWGMPVTDRFSIFAGYGTYRITSKLDYLGTTRASTFSLGYSAALSYVYPISEWVGVDMEVKWFNATETRHTLLAAQAHLVWKLHHW